MSDQLLPETVGDAGERNHDDEQRKVKFEMEWLWEQPQLCFYWVEAWQGTVWCDPRLW